MKKHFKSTIFTLIIVAIAAMVAIAQPGGAGGFGGAGGGGAGGGFGGMGGGMRMGRGMNPEAQMAAVDAIIAEANKMKELLSEQTAGGGMANFMDMTEEERTEMMTQMRERREKQTTIMAEMNKQVTILDNGAQLREMNTEVATMLNNIRTVAEEEEATAVVEAIDAAIAERNADLEAKGEELGVRITPRRGRGTRGGGRGGAGGGAGGGFGGGRGGGAGGGGI